MMWLHERSSKNIRLDSGEFYTEVQRQLPNHSASKEPYWGDRGGEERERKNVQRRYYLTLTVMKWRKGKCVSAVKNKMGERDGKIL